jgi:hypothetical protein
MTQCNLYDHRISVDQQQDLLGHSYTVSNGRLKASVYRLLDTGDPTDYVLNIAKKYYFISTVGNSQAAMTVGYHGSSGPQTTVCIGTITDGAEVCGEARQYTGPPESSTMKALEEGSEISDNYFGIVEEDSVNRLNLQLPTGGFAGYSNSKMLSPHFGVAWTRHMAGSVGADGRRLEAGYASFSMAAKTRGWVAIGFPKPGGRHAMEAMDVVMGRFDTDGSDLIEDRYAMSINPPIDDKDLGGKSDVYDGVVTREGEITYVSFKRALVTGDKWDVDFGEGKELLNVTFAYSGVNTDSLVYHGPTRGYSTMPWNQVCDVGSFLSTVSQLCTPCAVGRFAAMRGALSCDACEIGTYASVEGSSACVHCAPPGQNKSTWTTMTKKMKAGTLTWIQVDAATSNDLCGCDIGAQIKDGMCIPCPEGMICAGMGDRIIERGYAWDGEYSTYKCHATPTRCPGGELGKCAEGRDEGIIACARCEDGKTPEDEGRCKACGGGDIVLFCVVSFVLLMCCLLAYAMMRRLVRNGSEYKPTVVVSVMAGVLLTSVQQLAVTGLLAMTWPDPVGPLLRMLNIFTFDLDVIGISCVVSVSPVVKYTTRIVFSLTGFLFVALVHTVYVAVAQGCRFKENLPNLTNAMGTLQTVTFVSLVQTFVSPLQCDNHPNEDFTLILYPDILCWEGGDHITMMIVGLTALSVPFTFFSTALYATKVYPTRKLVGDVSFLKLSKFLFYRLRTPSYWYTTFLLARNAIVALSPALPTAMSQIIVLQLVMLFSFAVVLRFMPWRPFSANVVDALAHCGVILVISSAPYFVSVTDADIEMIAIGSLCVIFLMLLLILLGVFGSVFWLLAPRKKEFEYFICHHKMGAGVFSRLFKTQLLRLGSRKVFVDSDDLQNLDLLFQVVACELDCLTVIMSTELLRRPWCLGEITTAWFSGGPKVIPIMFPRITMEEAAHEDFVCQIAEVVDVGCLSQQSISELMVKDAVRWLRDLPRHSMHSTISETHFMDVIACLHKKDPEKHKFADFKQDACTNPDGQVAILVDYNDIEALSSAMVIKIELREYLSRKADYIPFLLPPSMRLGEKIRVALLVCTSNIFSQAHVLKAVYEAGADRMDSAVLPIVPTGAFRFPSEDWVFENVLLFEQLCPDIDALEIGGHIMTVFKEIAFVLHLNSVETNETLRAKCKTMSQRILRRVGLVDMDRTGSQTTSAIEPIKSQASARTDGNLPGDTEATATKSTATRAASSSVNTCIEALRLNKDCWI